MKPIKKSKQKAKHKAKDAQEDLQNKLSMFDRLPDNCMICNKSFDKKDKKEVKSWFVAVREKENKVNLYCPDCWNRAQSFIEELKKGMLENDRGN